MSLSVILALMETKVRYVPLLTFILFERCAVKYVLGFRKSLRENEQTGQRCRVQLLSEAGGFVFRQAKRRQDHVRSSG